MASFVLERNTVVKFGTISTSLYQYFREGIPSSVARDGSVDTGAEPSEKKGIYVGELMAYFSACAAFGQRTSTVHAANQIVLNRYVELLQADLKSKPILPGLEGIAAEIGLPIILEIHLEEDCVLEADTHFVADDEAENSWKQWRSGVIKREQGIPSHWIRQFYFPRLLDWRDLGAEKNVRLREQTSDTALMVGSLMQSWHKDAPSDLLLAYRRQNGRSHFSQKMPWDGNSLERFFNLNAMIDPATRIMNQMMIWQDLEALATKQGIPLE